MTGNQMMVFEVETYLEENFEFRRNVVSGKTEYRAINCGEWTILTEEALNSIVREAKKHGIGDDKSPRQDINEYVMSNAVKRYSPVCDFLDTLPKWDGQNHIAGLFNRIPGMTTETMGWCAVWFRSMVAHWLQMDSYTHKHCTKSARRKRPIGSMPMRLSASSRPTPRISRPTTLRQCSRHACAYLL